MMRISNLAVIVYMNHREHKEMLRQVVFFREVIELDENSFGNDVQPRNLIMSKICLKAQEINSWTHV